MESVKLTRIGELARKAWIYSLDTLKQPTHVPFIVLSVGRRVHLGELLKLTRHSSWLKAAGIQTVIDVGAHKGEFASAIASILPEARIYAFEPLPECFSTLRQRLGHRSGFTAYRAALGDSEGEVSFLRSNFSKASSLLCMTNLHKEAFPWSAETSPITVSVAPLDSYLPEMEVTPKTLLKIDVQGYEAEVLRGAVRSLNSIDYILMEVTFEELYEGQALFDDIYRFLSACGFSYHGSWDELLSPDGRVLQSDALFIRQR
jgi:FkbM family methyltransferase